MDRPVRIQDLVGQSTIKEVIEIQAQSAKQRDAIFPHAIFDAAAGSGKTTFALAIANELGKRVIKVNGASIRDAKELLPHLDHIYAGDILFIDEVHALPKKVCEFMYTILEDYEFTGVGRFIGQLVEVEKFTCIAATTHVGNLPRAFRDRFKHVYKFEPYSLEDLSEIVRRVFAEYKLKINQDTITKIAKTCRNNPRHVIKRAEFVRDYLITKGNMTNVLDIIRLSGYNKHGLTMTDVDYINHIGRSVVSLNNLSSLLNIPKKTIEEEIEPYLIEIGLVRISPKGRYIDQKKYRELNSQDG